MIFHKFLNLHFLKKNMIKQKYTIFIIEINFLISSQKISFYFFYGQKMPSVRPMLCVKMC